MSLSTVSMKNVGMVQRHTFENDPRLSPKHCCLQPTQMLIRETTLLGEGVEEREGKTLVHVSKEKRTFEQGVPWSSAGELSMKQNRCIHSKIKHPQLKCCSVCFYVLQSNSIYQPCILCKLRYQAKCRGLEFLGHWWHSLLRNKCGEGLCFAPTIFLTIPPHAIIKPMVILNLPFTAQITVPASSKKKQGSQ